MWLCIKPCIAYCKCPTRYLNLRSSPRRTGGVQITAHSQGYVVLMFWQKLIDSAQLQLSPKANTKLVTKSTQWKLFLITSFFRFCSKAFCTLNNLIQIIWTKLVTNSLTNMFQLHSFILLFSVLSCIKNWLSACAFISFIFLLAVWFVLLHHTDFLWFGKPQHESVKAESQFRGSTGQWGCHTPLSVGTHTHEHSSVLQKCPYPNLTKKQHLFSRTYLKSVWQKCKKLRRTEIN